MTFFLATLRTRFAIARLRCIHIRGEKPPRGWTFSRNMFTNTHDGSTCHGAYRRGLLGSAVRIDYLKNGESIELPDFSHEDPLEQYYR